VEIAPVKIVKTNPVTVCAECEVFKYEKQVLEQGALRFMIKLKRNHEK
jgi:hypothetical protein